MKIIIAGCRDITGARAEAHVSWALMRSGFAAGIDEHEIIHGGCRGIDEAAQRIFEGIFKITVVPADWASHSKAAGPIRNRQMAEMADALVAIWDGKSRGTKNMIDVATEKGLKVFVYRVDEE
jgi:predicted Rossmann fold nucleotide-binding protein DprA/Smf involved in DNA uptake